VEHNNGKNISLGAKLIIKSGKSMESNLAVKLENTNTET